MINIEREILKSETKKQGNKRYFSFDVTIFFFRYQGRKISAKSSRLIFLRREKR